MSLALKERELRLLPLRSLHGMGPQKSVLSTDNINDSCHDASELVENHVFLEENFPQNREYFFSRENENDPFPGDAPPPGRCAEYDLAAVVLAHPNPAVSPTRGNSGQIRAHTSIYKGTRTQNQKGTRRIGGVGRKRKRGGKC